MSCTCNLADIEKWCGEVNAAGLDRAIPICCDDDLSAIPAPDANTHVVSTNVALRAASAGPPAVTAGEIHTWNISKEDQSYSSEKDEATGVWKTEVKAFIPKMKGTSSFTFNSANGDNFILFPMDKNGKRRIVGEKGNGATLKIKEQTNPKNGYEVTATWESAHSPYFYEGVIPA